MTHDRSPRYQPINRKERGVQIHTHGLQAESSPVPAQPRLEFQSFGDHEPLLAFVQFGSRSRPCGRCCRSKPILGRVCCGSSLFLIVGWMIYDMPSAFALFLFDQAFDSKRQDLEFEFLKLEFFELTYSKRTNDLVKIFVAVRVRLVSSSSLSSCCPFSTLRLRQGTRRVACQTRKIDCCAELGNSCQRLLIGTGHLSLL